MKNFVLFLAQLFVVLNVALAGTTKFTNDNLQFGKNGSSVTHNLIFDYQLGTNPKLSVDSSHNLFYNYNVFEIGDGLTSTDKSIIANVGGSNPFITFSHANNQWQFSNDGTTVNALGSGSGGGGKNYLSNYSASLGGGVANPGNGDFEQGTTAGWSLGTLGVSANGIPIGTPSFGSGADSHLSITTGTVGALQKKYSLSYASSTATVQGNMLASNSFYIDSEDQAKVLTYKLYYQVTSGASNLNFSGTSSNSFGVAIWDVTNSAFIPAIPSFGFTTNSGSAYLTGVFQTAINTAQLRFIVYNVNASAGAAAMLLDDISVGPQTAPYGPAITDNVPWTPTFTAFGTVTGPDFYSYRDGQNLVVQGTFTCGTSTGSTAAITMGFNGADSNVNANAIVGSQQAVGWWAGNGANGKHGPILAVGPASSSLNFGLGDASHQTYAPEDGSTICSSTNSISVFYSIPIAGWSSNVQMSSDASTRVISWNGNAPGQASTANVTNITFNTVNDSNAAWNGTQYVVPVAGTYVASGACQANATSTCSIYLNGSKYGNFASQVSTSFSGGSVILTNLSPGDLISMRNDNNVFISTGNLGIVRMSGPAVIAATESVNMTVNSYTSTTLNPTVPTKFSNVVKDTHNAYSVSTGEYTVPVSGSYLVIGVLGGTNLGANTDAVYLNGTDICDGVFSGSVTSYNVSCVYPFQAGDLVDIRWNGGTVTETANAHQSYFNIVRVGN